MMMASEENTVKQISKRTNKQTQHRSDSPKPCAPTRYRTGHREICSRKDPDADRSGRAETNHVDGQQRDNKGSGNNESSLPDKRLGLLLLLEVAIAHAPLRSSSGRSERLEEVLILRSSVHRRDGRLPGEMPETVERAAARHRVRRSADVRLLLMMVVLLGASDQRGRDVTEHAHM